MATNEELDIITRMRSEVMSNKELTGENLFLAWGYPTALVLLFLKSATYSPKTLQNKGQVFEC